MLIKGIIEDIVDNYTVRVRIPEMHGIKDDMNSTPSNELLCAKICTNPGIDITFSVGDIVVIGFEKSDLSKPIILGFLYTAAGILSEIDINAKFANIYNDSIIADGIRATTINRQLKSAIEKLNDLTIDIENIKKQLNIDKGV